MAVNFRKKIIQSFFKEAKENNSATQIVVHIIIYKR